MKGCLVLNIENSSNEILHERFATSLAQRVGGRSVSIQKKEQCTFTPDGRTDLTVQGCHGEIQITIQRDGVEADRKDFLLLARIFDSIFPHFRIAAHKVVLSDLESSYRYEITFADNQSLQLSCSFSGQFSTTETHYMDWFILSEQYVTMDLLAIPVKENSYQPVLNAPCLGRSYQLEWVGQSQENRHIYRIMKVCQAPGTTESDALFLGQITISLLDLSSLTGGVALAIPLPVHIEAISAAPSDLVHMITNNMGSLKEFTLNQETYADFAR
jgi:hypothetical protein